MTSTSRLMLLASLTLAAAGCAGSPVIVASPSACSKVLPAEWEKGVGHAESPPPAPPKPQGLQAQIDWTLEQLKIWTGFAVDEANRVDQADGRTRDTIGIVRRCEERDAEAVSKSRPKVLGLF
jgi:hypothetical protein